jgi:hypothetical protein
MKEDLAYLKPASIKGKIRLGNNYDGGYVVYAHVLKSIDVLVTYGVGWDTSFEEHFNSVTGKKVFMFDHTMYGKYIINFRRVLRMIKVRRYKALRLYLRAVYQWYRLMQDMKRRGICFKTEGLSDKKENKLDTFASHIKRFGIQQKEVFLKIDIEGAEYKVFRDPKFYKNLRNVSQIVVEFHDIKNRLPELKQIFGKLEPSYTLVHVHCNNFGGTFRLPHNDVILADVMEFTFVKCDKILPSDFDNDLISFRPGLDFPNNPNAPDYQIDYSKFQTAS